MTANDQANPPQTRFEPCEECGQPFTPTRDWSRFCGDSCRSAHWRRTHEIKNPPTASGADTAGGLLNNSQLDTATAKASRQLREHTKIFSVLAELARGTRMTRFDAERLCHDHVLPSTIAEIQKRGIDVSREDVVVPGHRGTPTHCAEYWLTPEEIEKAAVLLGWKAWRDPS
jgi:hypothetical protein